MLITLIKIIISLITLIKNKTIDNNKSDNNNNFIDYLKHVRRIKLALVE